MGISFKAFGNCVEHVTNIRKPVLLRGRHGVGKSAVVYQFAKKIGLPLIERRASQMTEGDLLGLPKVNGDATEWLPPKWLKTACDEPVVLFLDEVDRATPEVRQGLFELTDSRKVAGWYLNEGTLIFAAINGGEYSSQYQVGEMDPAELDRWTVFDIEPTVDDWLNWARRHDINSIICDYISGAPQALEHTTTFEPNKTYPSRRSWHRFSDCLAKNGFLDDKDSFQKEEFYHLADAFLGMETALNFKEFLRTYEFALTAEDILHKGKIKETSGYNINEHSNLIDKITVYMEKHYKKDFVKAEIDNLACYFEKLPSECAIVLWEKIGMANLDAVKYFHQCKDRKVNNYLRKIFEGGYDIEAHEKRVKEREEKKKAEKEKEGEEKKKTTKKKAKKTKKKKEKDDVKKEDKGD